MILYRILHLNFVPNQKQIFIFIFFQKTVNVILDCFYLLNQKEEEV